MLYQVILRTGALVVAVCAAFNGWLLSNAYVEWAVLWEGQLRIVHTMVARFVFGASFCIATLVLNCFALVLLLLLLLWVCGCVWVCVNPEP